MIEILLYGMIGDSYEKLDAKSIRQQISDSEGDILVRINSGGGYVMEGLAIFNAFAEAKAAGRKVNVIIDGVAASMASVIAMVGEEIEMADNALMMIHNPWDFAAGDAEALRKKADLLDKIRDQLLGIYVARTGLSSKIITAMMTAETWMDADEALENKFITGIVVSSTTVAAIDVSKFGFAHAPDSPLITITKETPAEPVPETALASLTVPKEKNVDPELIKKILAFTGANNVSKALEIKALTGEITYDEMVAQHNAVANAEITVSASVIGRILAYAETHKVDAALSAKALKGEITVDQMIDQHTDAVALAAQDTNTSTVRPGASLDATPAQEAGFRAEMLTAQALASIGHAVQAPSERARAYGDQTVRSIAAFVCRVNGVAMRADASDREVITAALSVQNSAGGVISTGDLGNVLGQPLRAVFDRGYEDQLAETTYDLYTTEMTVPDFKMVSSVNVGVFSGIKKLSEGGPLPLARLNDGQRFMQIGTDGLKVSFTREAIINDEFGALLDAVNNLGLVVRQNEDDQAMDALIAGRMLERDEDGVMVESDVFDETYNNLISVAALDDAAMDKARLAMRSQKGKGGFRLNISPRILAVSPDLEGAALKLIAGVNAAAKLADVSVTSAMNLKLVVLDKLPAKTFYLMGAKQFAQIVKILRLAAARGPQIYTIPVADRRSLEWGMVNDFAAQCVGRIGIVMGTVA